MGGTKLNTSRISADTLGWIAQPGDPIVIQAVFYYFMLVTGEEDTSKAETAAIALWKVAYGDGATVGALIRLLGESTGQRRRLATDALAGTAPPGDQAVITALMIIIVQEDDQKVAEAASRSLAAVARGDKAVIAELIRFLEVNQTWTKRNAADVLGVIALPHDEGVMAALSSCIMQEKGKNASVAEVAGRSLQRVAPGPGRRSSSEKDRIEDETRFLPKTINDRP